MLLSLVLTDAGLKKDEVDQQSGPLESKESYSLSGTDRLNSDNGQQFQPIDHERQVKDMCIWSFLTSRRRRCRVVANRSKTQFIEKPKAS